MNRLSPLIVRRAGLRAAAAAAAASPLPEPAPFAGAEPAEWLQDLKLFAVGWFGGLVFFGTLIG